MDPRRRTPKIGYSYPSNQSRHGPAPLASFEDLPSDDQASPDDEKKRIDLSPDQDVIERALQGDARDLLNASPSLTITPVSAHSPAECSRDRRGSDTASQRTLTPSAELAPTPLNGRDSRTPTEATIIESQIQCHAEPTRPLLNAGRKEAWEQVRRSSHGSQQDPAETGVARKEAWEQIQKSSHKHFDERLVAQKDRTAAWSELQKNEQSSLLPEKNAGRKEAWEQLRTHHSPTTPEDFSNAGRKEAWEELRRSAMNAQLDDSDEGLALRREAWEGLRTGLNAQFEESVECRKEAWGKVREMQGPVPPFMEKNAGRREAWEIVRKNSHEKPMIEFDAVDPDTTGRKAAWEQLRKSSHSSQLLPPSSDEGASKSPSPTTKRKGSWTDIFFRGRSRSRSKSPTDRKSPGSALDESGKKKKGIFSIFKKDKTKSSVKEGALSPEPMPQRQLTTPRVSVTDTSESGGRSELLIPGNDDSEPHESQQDIIGIIEAESKHKTVEPQQQAGPSPQQATTSSAGRGESSSSPVVSRRSAKNRVDTDDDGSRVESAAVEPSTLLQSSHSSERSAKRAPTTAATPSHAAPGNHETVVVTIERRPDRDGEAANSSDEETDDNDSTLKGKKDLTTDTLEDDTEAANLLTQDSIDYDDGSTHDSIYNETSNSSEVQKVTQQRKERHEVTTIPVDRPRSTTPINIAPLEAFIRRASLSPDPSVERIKLSLPGEQFSQTSSARAKSPRKTSNPQIWLDFCERGLQSPRGSRKEKHRRRTEADLGLGLVCEGAQMDICVSHATPITSTCDAFTPVTDTPLTPVTPLEGSESPGDGMAAKWDTFGDSFDPSSTLTAKLNSVANAGAGCSSALILPEAPTECNKCDCRFFKGLSYGGDSSVTSLASPGDGDELDPECESLLPGGSSTARAISLGADLSNAALLASSEEQPLVSPNPCACDCHTCGADLASALWKAATVHHQDSLLSGSSDISSASSRLIGSSSSNSLKCSPDDALPAAGQLAT